MTSFGQQRSTARTASGPAVKGGRGSGSARPGYGRQPGRLLGLVVLGNLLPDLGPGHPVRRQPVRRRLHQLIRHQVTPTARPVGRRPRGGSRGPRGGRRSRGGGRRPRRGRRSRGGGRRPRRGRRRGGRRRGGSEERPRRPDSGRPQPRRRRRNRRRHRPCRRSNRSRPPHGPLGADQPSRQTEHTSRRGVVPVPVRLISVQDGAVPLVQAAGCVSHAGRGSGQQCDEEDVVSGHRPIVAIA
jgi:hypothetical protein